MPTISFELKNIEGLNLSGLVTKLAQGVKEQTEAVRLAWLQRVESEGRSRLKVYAEALGDSAIEYPVGGDLLYGQVIIRDNLRVRRLEEGGPQWNMKPGLLNGPKSRPMKKGGRYNIIPIGFSTESGFDAWQFHGVSPFRVVSSRSPANSWMYPAQEGFHFIADVVNDMRPVVARALSRILEEWQR